MVNFPPELQPLLDEFAVAPEHILAMWRYAIVLAMIDRAKVCFIEDHQDQETTHFVVETLAGRRFSVVRPPMSEEAEQMLLEQGCEIVAEDAGEN